MSNLPKLIDDYLKKKEFVFKDNKLYNFRNEIILDTKTTVNLNYTKKENNIQL
jgi:hypothetical protein